MNPFEELKEFLPLSLIRIIQKYNKPPYSRDIEEFKKKDYLYERNRRELLVVNISTTLGGKFYKTLIHEDKKVGNGREITSVVSEVRYHICRNYSCKKWKVTTFGICEKCNNEID